MRVLALDTTTARGSLALLEEDEVRAEVRVASAAGHSGWLLPGAQTLLTSLGWSLADLDGLAVTTGPGSFTGARVGVATVQGLAAGAGTPCLGFSTLDVLGSLGPANEPCVALMDAWRNEVYAAVYEGRQRVAGPYGGPLEGLVGQVPSGAAFVGDGVLRYRDRIGALWPEARCPEADLHLAPALGRLALRARREGRSSGPEELRLSYVRGVDIRLPAR